MKNDSAMSLMGLFIGFVVNVVVVVAVGGDCGGGGGGRNGVW